MTKNFQKYLLQIVLCQFITLWGPMFLSSLTLSISNPGFTFGYEPNTKMSYLASTCLILMDLVVFYLHPIILKCRISILKKQQEGIKGSRDLKLRKEYERNSKTLIRLNQQFYSFKKLELNFETIVQMTLSLLLYFYSTSTTRTSHSLLSVFSKESANDQLSQNETCVSINLSNESKIGIEVNVLKCLPPTVAIILNFSLSFVSFTR